MTGILTPVISKTDRTSRWVPKIGSLSNLHFNSLPANQFGFSAKKNLIKETYLILSSCHEPKKKEFKESIGLVVGRVQSGKTTSFKSLVTMGIDNGFELFILFAGRTKNLISQNKAEFENLASKVDSKIKVLSVEKPSDWKKVISSNLTSIDHFRKIKGQPIILITNKHAGHLKAIAKSINSEKSARFLNAMIIDDEADNASLNTAKDKNDEYSGSAIYRSIKNLRSVLLRHSVVQYTATPQALLLISKKDHYSPQWARVITPGENYVGAKELFSNESSFFCNVPMNETSSRQNISQFKLPSSFKEAFRAYLLTSAQRIQTPKKFHEKNSTFMVHPDVFTETHKHWETIIKDEVDLWKQDIEDNENRFLDFNRDEFITEYKKLERSAKKTDFNISNFEDLYKRVPGIISTLNIIQVNKTSNNINWDIPHNILIGGYMLDRGYVIQGLVTTYMPRGKGGGMIDSLQQRGRFYGYKKDHESFIRSWMTEDTIDAYKNYAKHEAHLYSTLENLSSKGEPLRDWQRLILLDKKLKPCRKNVIGIGLKNDFTWGGGWYWPAYPIAASRENRDLFKAIIDKYKEEFQIFKPKGIDVSDWTNTRRTLIKENVGLSEILLDAIRFYDPGELDEGRFATALTILSQLKDRNEFNASIILPGTLVADIDKYTLRTRPSASLPLTGTNYFQGKDANGSYPGERHLISENKKTINFHLSKLIIGKSKYPSYILAIKFPNENYLVEKEET